MLTLPLLLLSATLTVSLDGTQQYTSIQAAINDCFFSGDTVLVYPGRYVENLNTNNRRLTLASLYLNNPQQSYIDSTIIDGNLNSCISVTSGERVNIIGLTLVNNEQNSSTCPYGAGGGIYIAGHSTVNITSCIIRNCISWYGGGLSVGGQSSLTLSDVKIYNNVAIVYGGGIGSGETQSFIFDDLNRCSVYNNFAPFGMDIIITYVSYTPVLHEVYLAMGSIAMSEADNYFIVCRFADITVDAQTGYLEQVDADLYVSPTGSDDNSGLSSETPMRTIALAMQKIRSNPANPRTLHLAPGTYSHSGNGQILPFAIKSNLKLLGAGTAETIIDGEMNRSFIGGSSSDNFEISGISFINNIFYASSPIELIDCFDFLLTNLNFTNNMGDSCSGIWLNECHDGVIDNISVGQVSINNNVSSLFLFQCGTIYINNVLTYNNSILSVDYTLLGAIIYDSNVVFRNSIFANNTAQDAWLFLYQTIYPQYADRNLDMSNVLFMNNTVSNLGWVYCPIYMQNRFQPIQVNNVTIANNTTNTTLTRIFGYADIKNLISHNPGSPGELYLRNNLSTVGVQAEVSISNSLFRSNSVNADLPNLVTFNECIFGSNPLFLGTTTDTLSVTQPEYYYLSEGSPCINTGVADTTGMNLPLTDLAGNQRVWDGRIDMGCYEYGSPVSSEDPELPAPVNGINLSLYPNPVYANGSKGSYSFIEFTLPRKAEEPPVVEIYNLKGQKVRSLIISQSYNDLVRKAGLSKEVNTGGEFYSTVFDCKDMNSRPLATGIYLIRVKADGRQKTAKLTILR
jgi:hypothetical protein